MTPDRLHKLTARRDDVQAALLDLLAMPVANRLGPRGGKSAWPEEVKSCESLLKTLDASIAQLRPRPVETKPKRRRAVPPEQLDRREIARIAQDERTELRVSILLPTTGKRGGQRLVDVRLFYLAKSAAGWSPSPRGLTVAADKLDHLIAALRTASEHA